jgi:hypothetical protein
MKALKTLNAGKVYDVRKLGHPVGADPERFHLIAPYETDPRKWETMRWIDQYSKDGKRHRISASAAHRSPTAAVKSYGTVLREDEYHPEAKCADANGSPCRKGTIGLLGRRHVLIDGFDYIGKESNKLEEVEGGDIPSESDVYTRFNDPQRDRWATEILPFLRETAAQCIVHDTGISRRTVQRIRNEQTKPTAEHRRLLEAFAKRRVSRK